MIRPTTRPATDGSGNDRPAPGFVWRCLLWQLLLCVPVGVVLILLPEHQSLLGIKTEVHPILSLAAGAVLYLMFFLLIRLVQWMTGTTDRARALGYSLMRRIWPRQKTAKWIMVIAYCLLNPVTEEFFFRGVVVHLGAHYTGSLVLAVCAGLVLSIVFHLYQGVSAIPTQLLFHSGAIAILLSPLGLIGCVGYHIAADVAPLLLFRKYWKDYAVQTRFTGPHDSARRLENSVDGLTRDNQEGPDGDLWSSEMPIHSLCQRREVEVLN